MKMCSLTQVGRHLQIDSSVPILLSPSAVFDHPILSYMTLVELGKDHCQTLRSGRQLGEGWLWLPTPAACSGVRIWGTSTPPRVEEGRDKEEPFTPPKAALRGDGNQPSANLGPVSPSAANVAQGRGCTANEHTASSRNPCDLASGSGGLRSKPGGRPPRRALTSLPDARQRHPDAKGLG